MDDKEYIGSTIKGLCVPHRLLYPKLELEELPPGSFGILEVDVGSVLDGSIPATYNTGWVENPMYTICVRGLLPPLEKDETYYFECVVAPPKNPKYGLNFNLTRMNKQVRLTGAEQRKMFLESILTEHQIELLYDSLPDPFKTIDKGDLYTLSSIKGIGRVTAEKMLEKYTLNKNDIDAFLVLREEYGLTDTAVAKLHEKYHSTDTIIAKLRENPYELMEIDGYGFKKCDALALNGGMKETSKFRVAAYVQYFLQEQANVEGHSWIYLKDLLRGVVEFIPDLSKEKFADYLKEWSGRKESPEKPWLYYDEEQKRIGLKYYRDLEENICKELFRILNAPKRDLTKYKFSIEDAIKKCEEENGWEYTDEQLRAIHGCFDNNVTIITGNAGVGKSSTVKPIARFCRANGLSIEQTALSGRAASNLSEVTDVEGKTIHRLLEYKQGVGFGLTKENQLHSNVIIVDEVSMNDNDLFYALLQAVPDGCKIIMLGDICQLPSIGLGNLLKDCLETAVIPCYRLTKIHRQAQRSAIITESIRVSDRKQIIGKEPISEIRGELKDLKVVTYKNTDESRVKFLREYKELLDKGISVNYIVGVVPNRTRGALSCLQLNNDVQRFVNNDSSLPHITAGNAQEGYYTIRLGDRIINRKNHYDTMTVKEYRKHLPKKLQNSEPIYNGNLGFVTEVNSDYIIVDFKQQGEIVIPRKYWEDLMLGYVVTAHSFQGSQAPYVVVGLDMAAYTLLSKEWTYTALTRAKKYCVLVGQISAIQKSVAISRVKKKQTWLKELLLNYENPEKTLDNEV